MPDPTPTAQGPDASRPDQTRLSKLVAEVMRVERRYAHELRNVQSERRNLIREAIEKLVKTPA